MQGALEGAVAVDRRVQRYVLGRTSDAQVVSVLSGGPAVRTFPQDDRHRAAGWQALQDLEAGGGQRIPTFPSTPEAWNQAWDAYQRLERAGGG
jgi:hypothetical protein